MSENKTPDPKKPGGDQNPNDMGGPSFHPDIGQARDKSKIAKDEISKAVPDTEILSQDQVPPL